MLSEYERRPFFFASVEDSRLVWLLHYPLDQAARQTYTFNYNLRAWPLDRPAYKGTHAPPCVCVQHGPSS
jgi:hypothetical protein